MMAFDEQGREIYITRQQWWDTFLMGDLEEKRDNPDELYSALVQALNDGFAADIVPYAEHLARTDPIPARGITLLGALYIENDRLDDAERVLNDFLSAHGEDGYVLANLAKIYSRRGDDARAEAALWHALEVDPNQDNGFGWYMSIHQERGGEPALLDAYRRVAALPRSWRAQLWLARDALQKENLSEAEASYAEALARAGRPIPPDFLMQMSADLGESGYLEECVRLVTPHFDPAFHGMGVGNNLIKANMDLGRKDTAGSILNRLRAQNRPEWQEMLDFWDGELAGTNAR
jgi:predicted Zn-dependent protease